MTSSPVEEGPAAAPTASAAESNPPAGPLAPGLTGAPPESAPAQARHRRAFRVTGNALVGATALAFAGLGVSVGERQLALGAAGIALATVLQQPWGSGRERNRFGQLPAVLATLIAPWTVQGSAGVFAASAMLATGLVAMAHPVGAAAVVGALGSCALAASNPDELPLLGATVLGCASIVGFSHMLGEARTRAVARRRTQQQLVERYTLASEGAQTGLWHWTVSEDHVYLTPRAVEYLGLPARLTHPVTTWLDALGSGDSQALRTELARFIASNRGRFEQRARVNLPGRGERTLLFRGCVARDARGVVRLGGSIEDVTAALRQERELLRSSFHDALTGLANRALLLDRLSHAIAQCQRYPGRPFAILFLDVDNFKHVNDSLGHQIGDALLCTVAERLERCLRPSDTLARFGGDEFVVLGHELGVGQAEALAERMMAAIRTPFVVQGHEIVTSASIGVAPGGPGYVDGLDLLRDADTAMYRAKHEGRGRVCVFTEAMHAGAVLRLEVERDLHHAVDRGELEVHYQPIIGLTSGQVHGFEALVRWRKDGELIKPDQFIPVAEETGQIVPMTWWILEEACRTLADWRRRGLGDDIWVHVNFSGRQLSEGNAVVGILAVIQRYNLPPGVVHIELTETSVLRQGSSVDGTINELRAAGVQLHLDDFGTGYASISYLHHWRFDGLKIDGSFIRKIEDPTQRSIVAAVIQLARGLDMHVIAEGVETEAQAAILRELGCQDGQGWLWSRALPPEEARAMLAAQNTR